jgi:hypothetical protein
MLSPNFSLHLESSPFEAVTSPLAGTVACVLEIREPNNGLMSPLALFFPADKLEQVQRLADALNEIGKSIPAASNPLAA